MWLRVAGDGRGRGGVCEEGEERTRREQSPNRQIRDDHRAERGDRQACSSPPGGRVCANDRPRGAGERIVGRDEQRGAADRDAVHPSPGSAAQPEIVGLGHHRAIPMGGQRRGQSAEGSRAPACEKGDGRRAVASSANGHAREPLVHRGGEERQGRPLRSGAWAGTHIDVAMKSASVERCGDLESDRIHARAHAGVTGSRSRSLARDASHPRETRPPRRRAEAPARVRISCGHTHGAHRSCSPSRSFTGVASGRTAPLRCGRRPPSPSVPARGRRWASGRSPERTGTAAPSSDTAHP